MKTFFYIKLGFIQSHSGPLGDIKRFVRKKVGSYKNEKPINITRIDKVHLKRGCINESIFNGVTEPILYNCALQKTSRPINTKLLGLNFLKKLVLSHITFYLEDDDDKTVHFSGEMIGFTFQILEKYFQIF